MEQQIMKRRKAVTKMYYLPTVRLVVNEIGKINLVVAQRSIFVFSNAAQSKKSKMAKRYPVNLCNNKTAEIILFAGAGRDVEVGSDCSHIFLEFHEEIQRCRFRND